MTTTGTPETGPPTPSPPEAEVLASNEESVPEELLIQFVRGEPDDEQVAAATVALLAVLRQKAAADDDLSGRAGRSSRPPGWTPDSYAPPGAWSYG
ncbi:acyl-CoA carboxylase epsilon subunit [Streptomyces sp. H10-C2]|uniref:acyl-CoA carboxylase epsilon subunit n=1 Tax=unclassified Streptomyces TaxID=2593676 RepID=UPI0024B8DA2B|nr:MULTISPECIES: acyl-CoA carboxylase epsilon subunit [unclassified Streptomyces]MDJ0342554.1 acyl-CoA carboxylase epsilon subunit [Streptomyces sp. PH10-H1]MDJ0370549.1 acyl-CoA carboxylase epsilon subunit [Streptomyces sp. H10-C2]